MSQSGEVSGEVSGVAWSSNDPFVRKALREFEGCLQTTRSFQDVCRRIGISETCLRGRFVRDLGMPPGRYLRRYRATRARLLLRDDPTKPQQAVARAVGYGSAEAMSRAIRREFGCTPGQARYRNYSPVEGGIMNVPVSVSMIVKNEEEGIARAIASAREIPGVDDVVVVDTGSSDRTVEIARQASARVVEEPWAGDFSYHRNRSAAFCVNDWVFIIDGDEELLDVGDVARQLRKPRADGIAMTVECEARGQVREKFLSVRLFDRRKGRWKYPVHSQLLGLQDVVSCTGRLVAHYDGEFQGAMRTRLATLLEHERGQPQDPHYPFFIAKTYRALYDLESTRTWARKFLDLGTGETREAEAWVWLVDAAFHDGDAAGAQQLCDRGLQQYPGFADLLHRRMTLAMLEWYRAATQVEPRYQSISSSTIQHTEAMRQVIGLLGLPLEVAAEGG